LQKKFLQQHCHIKERSPYFHFN